MINSESLNNIILRFNGSILTIQLDRPAVHNAFNAEMLQELESVFQWFTGRSLLYEVRINSICCW